ncbi:photosystem II protein Psb27 [Synechococcus sp. H60.3]|uniref:photosystem II protein Psb27 n=1 Tax=unclassified Synechococcus TaxID=2626047 RepID=UPI0039C0398E
MLKTFFLRLLGLLLSVILVLGWTTASAQAARLTGKYYEDSMTLIQTLRTVLSEADPVMNPAEARAEVMEAMQEFAGRYHGHRYDKLQSFTTLRTVFNTVASHYRTSNRPLDPEKVERVLMQLDRAELALRREG